jgi:hypothetical protein
MCEFSSHTSLSSKSFLFATIASLIPKLLLSETYRITEVEDFQEEVRVHQFGNLGMEDTKRELVMNDTLSLLSYGGCRSVGIIRLRTKATEFTYFL